MRALAIVLLAALAGCSTLAPEKRVFPSLSDAEVELIRYQIGTDATPEQIREDRIDFAFEVKVPCSEMLAICYAGMHPFWIALGAVPLACTRFYIGAERDHLNRVTGVWKTAIAYGCALTPGWAWEHEREHLKGMGHL